jgi:lipid-A-disaccharide synthase
MKYFIVAGEASGDLHASNLMKGIKKNDPDAQFLYFGGDLMAEQGGTLIKHYRDMAFMGFLEVLLNLRTIKANMELCKQSIVEYKPDIVILVDYPGFNLRIAKFAKQSGFKVFYYIAPKVWAWKESRVKKLKRFVDKQFVIFPF